MKVNMNIVNFIHGMRYGHTSELFSDVSTKCFENIVLPFKKIEKRF